MRRGVLVGVKTLTVPSVDAVMVLPRLHTTEESRPV